MSKHKKSHKSSGTIFNRRAGFDYQLGEDLVVGIVLNGREVRAVRNGHVHLKGSFVTIRGGELWLNNASFSVVNNNRGETNQKTVDTSPRKLLLHKKQLLELEAKKQAGFSIVALKIFTDTPKIKVVIATAKGKKLHDKRQTIKRRDQEREQKRMIKTAL